MLDSHSRPTTPEFCPNSSPSSSVHSSPSKSTNANGKRVMIKSSGPATRRGEHLKTVRAALLNWRYKTYKSHYSPSPFTSVVILPDPTLTALASNARIKSVADMQQVLKPPWVFASKHGPEILELLEKLDKADKEGRECEKLKRREQKKEETAQRRDAEKLQKKLKSATPQLPAPMYPVPSPRRVLVDSSQFNMPTYVAYTVCFLLSFSDCLILLVSTAPSITQCCSLGYHALTFYSFSCTFAPPPFSGICYFSCITNSCPRITSSFSLSIQSCPFATSCFIIFTFSCIFSDTTFNLLFAICFPSASPLNVNYIVIFTISVLCSSQIVLVRPIIITI